MMIMGVYIDALLVCTNIVVFWSFNGNREDFLVAMEEGG